LQQQLLIFCLARGQYSEPSFIWQQQASILFPVSVHIRPDSDLDGTLPEAKYPPSTANSIRAIIAIRILDFRQQNMNIFQNMQTRPLPNRADERRGWSSDK
jgi:hypothetical protein